MSYVYNLTEVFRASASRLVDFTKAEIFSKFYLQNSNPNRQEIEELCSKTNSDINTVIAYIQERKEQQKKEKNIVQLKFGREYVQPYDEEKLEYLTYITDNDTKKSRLPKIRDVEREKDYNLSLDSDIYDEIPKKQQNSEEDEINFKSNKKEYYSNKFQNNSHNFDDIKIKKLTDNISANNNKLQYLSFNTKVDEDLNQASTNSVARLFNSNFQHSMLPYGLHDTKLVQNFILFMKKDLKIEVKHEISLTLSKTSNSTVLELFLQFDGAQVLTNWLQDLKDRINDSQEYSYTVILNNILINLLNFCEKLKISLHDLKYSKIGKVVNKLAKHYSHNKNIQVMCTALVNKWKKIVEETKGKKDENEEDEKDNKNIDINQSLLKNILNKGEGKNYNLDKKSNEFLNKKKHVERNNDKNNKKSKKETFENRENSSNESIKKKDFIPYKRLNELNKPTNNLSIPNQFILNQNSFLNNTMQIGLGVQPNSIIKPKGALKGILKVTTTNQQMANISINNRKKPSDKKKIKFENDVILEKVKVFKLTDEPNAPNITDEEYHQIQREILKDPSRSYLGDMKLRESNLEKENLFKVKEKIKTAKDLFERMVPEIKIIHPLEIYIESPYEEGEDIDEKIVDSKEKEKIDQFLNKILMTTYFKESDIPPTPKMGPSEMFEFFDTNIPKIENLKTPFDTDKTVYEVDFTTIEDNKTNPEFLKNIAERINNSELSFQSEEERNKLLEILQNQIKKSEDITEGIIPPMLNPPNLIANMPNINPMASNLLNMKMNIPHQMQPNIANKIFPLSHMNMGHLPIVPPFPPMNNMINPNNMMNINMNINMNMNFQNQNMNISNQNLPNNNLMNLHTPNLGNSNIPINSFASKNMNLNNSTFGDSRKNFNQEKQVNITKFRTRPCRNYHGPNGCQRGDDCHFIHDKEFAGTDIPQSNLPAFKQDYQNPNSDQNIPQINQNGYNNNFQMNRFKNVRNFNGHRHQNFGNKHMFNMNNQNTNVNQYENSSTAANIQIVNTFNNNLNEQENQLNQAAGSQNFSNLTEEENLKFDNDLDNEMNENNFSQNFNTNGFFNQNLKNLPVNYNQQMQMRQNMINLNNIRATNVNMNKN